jgi:NADPH:quinone reductase-like Zn-dependent oxidoreductase
VKGCHLYGFAMFNATTGELQTAGEDVNGWLAAGQIKPCIDRVLPLSDTATAHKLQDESTVGKSGALAGKIVLRP